MPGRGDPKGCLKHILVSLVSPCCPGAQDTWTSLCTPHIFHEPLCASLMPKLEETDHRGHRSLVIMLGMGGGTHITEERAHQFRGKARAKAQWWVGARAKGRADT